MTPSELKTRTAFAECVARDAGILACRYFRREIAFDTELKGPQDFVTVADRAVEALIRKRIGEEYPNDSFLGEEGGGAIGAHAWCVDPIDGTINFVHGVRYWCISIAFMVDERTAVGVIYDAVSDEMFVATRGAGAFCNGSRIHVSTCSRISESLICAGYCARQAIDEHVEQDRALLGAGAAVKDMGAGALMLAHVAAGRYDGYVESHMHPWDALAGLLLIDEAGGRTLAYPGPSGLAAGGEVLAAAPRIFDELATLRIGVAQRH